MKTLSRLLLAGCVLAGSGLRAELSAQAWLETYYLAPAPDELPRGVHRLAAQGYFERAENIPTAIGFLSAVFAQHPDRVAGWLQQLDTLSPKASRLVAAAVWQSGHPLGADLLRKLAATSPVRAEIERLATLPGQTLAETPVQSASSLRLQWGAFLATGDEKHILRIFDAIGNQRPELDHTAQLALAQSAATHPRVLEICRAQLDRQPEEVRSVLRAALQNTGAPPPRT